jgi:hypothetical protein
VVLIFRTITVGSASRIRKGKKDKLKDFHLQMIHTNVEINLTTVISMLTSLEIYKKHREPTLALGLMLDQYETSDCR